MRRGLCTLKRRKSTATSNRKDRKLARVFTDWIVTGGLGKRNRLGDGRQADISQFHDPFFQLGFALVQIIGFQRHIHQSLLDGIEFLQKAGEVNPDVPIIIISGHGNIETAVEAVKKGAFDYISKPPDLT